MSDLNAIEFFHIAAQILCFGCCAKVGKKPHTHTHMHRVNCILSGKLFSSALAHQRYTENLTVLLGSMFGL